MSLLQRLRDLLDPPPPSGATRPEPVRLAGKGDFAFPVVGESRYQANLERICGGRTEDSHEFICQAILVLEDENTHDAQAVRVDVSGMTVGYLSREDARAYRELLKERGQPRLTAICVAEIRGGWDRGPGDQGHFGVWLDLPGQSQTSARFQRPVVTEDQRIRIDVRDFFMVPTPNGYDLHRESGLVPWVQLRPDDPVWAFKIVGVQYRDDGTEILTSQAFAPGSRVTLRREPDNPHDENAVAVLDAAGERQVGYVPSEWAEELAGRMDPGESPAAWVVRENLESGRRIGAWVMVVDEGVAVHWGGQGTGDDCDE